MSEDRVEFALMRLPDRKIEVGRFESAEEAQGAIEGLMALKERKRVDAERPGTDGGHASYAEYHKGILGPAWKDRDWRVIRRTVSPWEEVAEVADAA